MLSITLSLLQRSSPDISSGLPCFIVLVVLVIILVVVHNEGKKAEQARQEAYEAYQKSLARLKSNPINADLRQQALNLGRKYSNLTRDKKGVTVYDEVALMNDINAACAGAASMARPQQGLMSQTIEERLAKLSELKSKGLISEQEYTSRRQRILDEV